MNKEELQTEQEVMASWRGDVVVSVCCVVYNHGKYIEQALQGMLQQQTNFPYEIVVHDDASTDNSKNIISKYEKDYPNIIKTIYQSTNQYSQGRKSVEFMFPVLRGDYVAFCEGDDYWEDEFKLQKQVDELKKHPDINLCFHPVKTHTEAGVTGVMSNHMSVMHVFSCMDVLLGGASFCPTSSLIIKKNVIKNMPDWFYTIAPVGDFFLQLYGSRNGALYIPNVMSVYRVSVKGSWSARHKANPLNIYNHTRRMNTALRLLGDDFYDDIVAAIHVIQSKLIVRGIKKLLRSGNYRYVINICVNLRAIEAIYVLRMLIYKAISKYIMQ